MRPGATRAEHGPAAPIDRIAIVRSGNVNPSCREAAGVDGPRDKSSVLIAW